MSLTNSRVFLAPKVHSQSMQGADYRSMLISVKKEATASAPKANIGVNGMKRRGRPLGSKNAPKLPFMQNGAEKKSASKRKKDSAKYIDVVSDVEKMHFVDDKLEKNVENLCNSNSAPIVETGANGKPARKQRAKKELILQNEEQPLVPYVASVDEQAQALSNICDFIEKTFISTGVLFSDIDSRQKSENLSAVLPNLQRIQFELQQVGSIVANYFGLPTLGAWLGNAAQSKTFQQCSNTALVLVQLICGPTATLTFDSSTQSEIAGTVVQFDARNVGCTTNVKRNDEKRSSAGHHHAQHHSDWRRVNIDSLLHCNPLFTLFNSIERMWDSAASTLPHRVVSMFYQNPNCWRALFNASDSHSYSLSLDSSMLAKLVCIVDSNMTAFVEQAVSGIAFAPQSFSVAVNCCFEKMRTFERPLIEYIAESSSETYNVFWNSASAIEFQRRVCVIVTLHRAAAAFASNGGDENLLSKSAVFSALKKSLSCIAAAHALPLTHLFDLLSDVIGRNAFYEDEFYACALADWQLYVHETRQINASASFEDMSQTCRFETATVWLLKNACLSDAQREMQTGDVGALQKRLQECLDEDRAPIHEQFVKHGFAVDDSNPKQRVPLPILVCYERSQPATLDSEKDYSNVLVHGSKLFRAYGVFLYTRSPESNQSRFALMMWLTPPYAGEIVVALTPFCQGLIDYYISGSERTAASGYTGLKYYSLKERGFVTIDNILSRRAVTNSTANNDFCDSVGADDDLCASSRVGSLYNRIQSTVALDLRKAATLRESKVSLYALARPPHASMTRESHYLSYEIEEPANASAAAANSEECNRNQKKWRNYVHPAAATRLWSLGYRAAKAAISECISENASFSEQEMYAKLLQRISEKETLQMQTDLHNERCDSRALLGVWQQNFFEKNTASTCAQPPSEDYADHAVEIGTEKRRKKAK